MEGTYKSAVESNQESSEEKTLDEGLSADGPEQSIAAPSALFNKDFTLRTYLTEACL